VVVDFGMGVLVGPFVVLGLPTGNRLAILFDAIVIVVSQNEPVVIQTSSLHNYEELGFGEGGDFHGGGVIKGVFVVNLHNFLGLEVDDIDFGFGDIENDDLFLIHHSEEVNDVVILSAPDLFTRSINMDNAFFSTGFIHPYEDECVIEGTRCEEYLGPLLVKLDGGFIFQQHILKIIKE